MIDLSRIRLIALDLDKTTLLDDKTISPGNRSALEAAVEAGIHVVVASGRPLASLPDCILEIPGIEYAITSNGAAVYRLSDRQRIHGFLLEPESVDRILELLPDTQALEAFVDGIPYSWEEFVRDPEAFGVRGSGIPYILSTRRPVKDIRAFIREHRDCLDAMDVRTQNRREAEEILELLTAKVPSVYMTASMDILLEISHADAGKHSGMLWLGEQLGIPTEQMAAFGDAANDMDMIRTAGLGVAMANAEPELRAVADRITASNEEDGVALVIREILEGRIT